MAAPAYDYGRTARAAVPQRNRAVRPQRRPDSSVVPGQRRGAAQQTLPQNTVMIFATVAFAMLVVALACILRVGFAAGAASTIVSTQITSAQLSQERSASSVLEVQSTQLSNPERVKAEATKLGMMAPAETQTLILGEDVVAVGQDGALSLGQSLARATGSSTGK